MPLRPQAHRVRPNATDTTVNELTGIKIAATTGVSSPCTAKYSPTKLCANEIANNATN